MSVKTILLQQAIDQAELLERSNERLQQQVWELQRENRELRSRLDAIHGASVTDRPDEQQDQRADPRKQGPREATRAHAASQLAQGGPAQFATRNPSNFFGAGIS